MARLGFWLSVLLGVTVTAIGWFVLPARVPLHFGTSGDVDRWGSRTQAVVETGAVIGGLTLLFWVLTIVVPRTPETMLNLPARDKAWWLADEERRAELNRRLVADLHALGAATLTFVVGVEGLIMAQARSAEPTLGPWLWVLLALYLVGVLGYTGYMVAVRYRAPRQR